MGAERRRRRRRNRHSKGEPPKPPPLPTYASRIAKSLVEEEQPEQQPDEPHPRYSESELKLARLLTPRITVQQYVGRDYHVPERPKGPYEYALWRSAYDSYIRRLYTRFVMTLNELKVELYREIELKEFSALIYHSSSGYISPWL